MPLADIGGRTNDDAIKNRYKNNNYACNVIVVSNSIDIYNMSSAEELQRQIQLLQQQLLEQQNQSSSNATGHLTVVPAAPVFQPAPAVHVTSTVPPHHRPAAPVFQPAPAVHVTSAVPPLHRHHHQAHQVEPETDVTLLPRTVFLGVDLFNQKPENTDFSELVQLGRQDQTLTNVDEELDAYCQRGIQLLSKANKHLGGQIENIKNELIFNNFTKRAESFGAILDADTRSNPAHANVATNWFHNRAELGKWAKAFVHKMRFFTFFTDICLPMVLSVFYSAEKGLSATFIDVLVDKCLQYLGGEMDALVKLEEPSSRRKKHSLLQKIKELVNSKKRNDQLVMDILFSVFVGDGLIEQLGGSASIQYARQPNSVRLPPVEFRDENGQLRQCELIYLYLPNLPEGITTDEALRMMEEWDWHQELVASVPVPTPAPAAAARRQQIVHQGVHPVGPTGPVVVRAGHHAGLQPYEPVPTLAPAAAARRQQIVHQGVPPVGPTGPVVVRAGHHGGLEPYEPVPTLAPAAAARRQQIVVNQGVPPVGPAGPVVQAGHHGGLQPYEPVPTLAPAAAARCQQIVVNQGVPPVEQQPGDMAEVALQKYVEDLIDKDGSGSREAVFNPNTNPVRIDSTFDSTFDSESAEKRRQKKGELQRRTEASLAKKSNNDDNVKQRSNNIRSMGMSEDQPQEQKQEQQQQQQQQQENKGEKRNNDDVVEIKNTTTTKKKKHKAQPEQKVGTHLLLWCLTRFSQMLMQFTNTSRFTLFSKQQEQKWRQQQQQGMFVLFTFLLFEDLENTT